MVRFVWIALFTGLLTACGGAAQAPTPTAPSLPAGYMRVVLRVAGTLDFSKYQYDVIFNTSGNGLTPEAGKHKTNWAAYSAAVQIGGDGAPYVQPILYVKSSNPHVPPARVRLSVTPAQLQFFSNGGAFSITFERSIFAVRSNSLSNSWRFNGFSLRSGELVDTMGRCGSCFRSPVLAVNTAFDQLVKAQTPKETIPPAARILSVGFENNP
jgi:hypothetical protein